MVLVERKLFALPETSWLWLATQFLAHDWFSLSHISFEDLSVFKACLADRSISRWRDSAHNFGLSVLLFFFCIFFQEWKMPASLIWHADLSSAVDRIEERLWDKGKKEGTCRKPRIFLGTEFEKFESWKAELIDLEVFANRRKNSWQNFAGKALEAISKK